MRAFVIGIAFLLSSCATPPKPVAPCPTPSKIGASESLTDYTVRLLKLYDECARSRAQAGGSGDTAS